MASNALLSASGGAASSVLRAAETNIAVAAKLLKKTVEADKNMIETLLPTQPTGGKVDIRA